MNICLGHCCLRAGVHPNTPDLGKGGSRQAADLYQGIVIPHHVVWVDCPTDTQIRT